jgi:F-type H+-transporting ATPase subunit delta
MQVSVAAAGLSGRYAAALFGLAKDQGRLDEMDTAVRTLRQALAQSSDFERLVLTRHLPRSALLAAVQAVAAELALPDLMARFLGVVAQNGRLHALPAILRDFEARLGAERGFVRAEVISAQPLSADQVAALESKLKARTGRTITADVTVDPEILGGLVVRIGSQQIDSSVRTRLERLGQQMKG